MNTKIQKIYDDESWKLYIEEIRTFVNNDIKAFFTESDNAEVKQQIDEAIASHRQYKKEFNWALFYTLCIFSPILVLLIVPAYWTIKKIKTLNTQRKDLKAKFEKENNERIDALKFVVQKINFYKVIEKALHHIGYKWMGPIPSHFVKTINKYVVFDSDYVQNSTAKNNYISSWGTFNDQLVILNVSTKKHEMVDKVYSKTEIFSYTYYNGKETVHATEAVTAHYTHPFPDYKTDYHVCVFTPSCEGLKFNLSEYKYNPFSSKQEDKRYQPFDNKDFDKSFKIQRNDEAMVRMFYTADVQEYLCKARETYKKELPDYLKYLKQGSLVSSEYLVKNPYCHKNAFNWSLLIDVNVSLEDVTKRCNDIILEIVKQRFLSLNFVTSIPLLMTQFNKPIIQELTNLYKVTTITPEDATYAQYVLNAIWEDEIMKCDTSIMNVFEVTSKKLINNNLVVTANINANGYTGHKRYKSVTVYGVHVGARVINVPYVDYLPTENNAKLYYARLNTSNFFVRGHTDFDAKIVKAINDSGLAETLIIKNRHMALVDLDGNLQSKFINLLQYFTQDEQSDDLLKNLFDFTKK